MKIKLTLLLLFICGIAFCAVGQNRSVVKILPRERWWGGSSALGGQMPFAPSLDESFLTFSTMGQSSSFLVSSKGRFVWSKAPFQYQFDVNGNLIITSYVEQIKVEQRGETLREAYLFAAHKYFAPSGLIPDSLLFTSPVYQFDVKKIYGGNISARLKTLAESIKESKLPKGIIAIGGGWQTFNGSFEFDKEHFVNIKSVITQLQKDGFKVIVQITPFLSPDSEQFLYMRNEGMLKGEGGKAQIFEWQGGYSAMYDLSSKKVQHYIDSTLKHASVKYNLDGFAFDNITTDNYQTTREDMTLQDAEKGVETSTFLNSLSSGFAVAQNSVCFNGQKHAMAHSVVSEPLTWKSLNMIIPNMLAAGLLGYPYLFADLDILAGVGYGEKIDEELVVRLVQLQSLMPIMQFPVLPTGMVSETTIDYCRKSIKLREKLGGYILEQAKVSSTSGTPIIRTLEYQFPDKGFYDCIDQYMLGSKYLVAPFLDNSRSRTVRLPNGHWVDDQGKLYNGPAVIKVTGALDRIPYFEYITRSEYLQLKRKRR